MVLLLHIAIALSSIGFSFYTVFRPSAAKLRAAYGLVAATLISGTYLVWTTHAPLPASCLTGLIYLGVVTTGLVSAHAKLAKQNSQID